MGKKIGSVNISITQNRYSVLVLAEITLFEDFYNHSSHSNCQSKTCVIDHYFRIKTSFGKKIMESILYNYQKKLSPNKVLKRE